MSSKKEIVKKENSKKDESNCCWGKWDFKNNDSKNSSSGTSMIYFLGFLGALVYNVQTATTLVGIIIGVLKAIVWPAFLVYGALKFLGL